MALTPRQRKLALTAHVTASVGWLGAVIAFLALSVAGLTSQDPQTVQGAYLVMELTGWVVLFKLAINLVATIVLLLHADPCLPRRHCRRDGLVRYRASRAQRPIPGAARGRRPPAPAGGHDTGHL
jgi:hypothetical protein